MNQLHEIETAIDSLPLKKYIKFRNWFLERDWIKWDKQIEADSKSGNLNFLLKEADEAVKNKKLKAL